MCNIYKITNRINNKLYIGETTSTLIRRWSKHKSCANVGKTDVSIYADIRKYGEENFTIELIEECPDEIGREREKYWINYYESIGIPTYNIRNKHISCSLSQEEIDNSIIVFLSMIQDNTL